MTGRFAKFMTERSALALAIGASVVLVVLMFLVYSMVDKFGTDFGVYWQAANGPVTAVYELRPKYPFPYAPTMLLWIKPLAYLPKWPAFYGWFAISVMTFTWVNRKYLTKQENWLALISPPAMFCFMTGQVSVFLAAMVFWAIGTDRRIGAGVALGIVATIKPQLVAMAPLLLAFRCDWRAFVSAGATFLVVIAIAIFTFGTQPWYDWVGSFENFKQVLHNDRIIRAVASPAGQAEYRGLNPTPFLLIGAAFGVWLTWRCRNMGVVERTAAVGAGSIFASPYALTYDLAIVVPYLAVAVFRGRVAAALAIAGSVPPFPIVLTAFELIAGKLSMARLLRRKSTGRQSPNQAEQQQELHAQPAAAD